MAPHPRSHARQRRRAGPGRPGAYGIQVYSPKGLLLPLRAGFVLLSPEEGAVAGRRTPLTPLLATPYGILYRNDEAFGLTARPEAAP